MEILSAKHKQIRVALKRDKVDQDSVEQLQNVVKQATTLIARLTHENTIKFSKEACHKLWKMKHKHRNPHIHSLLEPAWEMSPRLRYETLSLIAKTNTYLNIDKMALTLVVMYQESYAEGEEENGTLSPAHNILRSCFETVIHVLLEELRLASQVILSTHGHRDLFSLWSTNKHQPLSYLLTLGTKKHINLNNNTTKNNKQHNKKNYSSNNNNNNTHHSLSISEMLGKDSQETIDNLSRVIRLMPSFEMFVELTSLRHRLYQFKSIVELLENEKKQIKTTPLPYLI